MNVMEYYRHEPHDDPVRVCAGLVEFVYDVPCLTIQEQAFGQ